ncbi:MAG: hypothetical protein GY866_22800 [Proteobacteria bacterium]|nr:hypothetical protein [Pseudomonadota bacterium]
MTFQTILSRLAVYLPFPRILLAFNCFLACSLVWLTGVLGARIVENEILKVPHQKAHFVPPAREVSDTARKFSKFKAIIDMNVFDAEVSSQVVVEVVEPERPAPGATLNQILSNLRLRGIGAIEGGLYCIIRDKKKKKEEVFFIDDTVFETKTIISKIVTRFGGQKVYLKLEEEVGILEYAEDEVAETKSKRRVRPLPRRKERSPPPLKSSYTTDGKNFHIESSEVDSHMKNFGKLVNQARMVPFFHNGQHKGFQIKAIDKGSLYEKLGLKNRDVIKAVNGEELNTMDKAVSLLKTLKNEREFTFQLERKGSPMTLNYYVD